MTSFIIRRFLLVIPMCLGVTLVAFLIMNTIPGDPVLLIVGDATATNNPHALEVYRHVWGFDQPLPTRFLIYLQHLAHGDFGTSIMTGRPVGQELRDYFPATAELALFGSAFGLIFGVPLGVFAALNHNRIGDHVARLVALLGTSTPSFWLALIAIQIFFVELHIAPGIGRLDVTLDPPHRITGMYIVDAVLTGNWDIFWNALEHLLLPAMTLGYGAAGLISRMVRESLLRTLNSDYVRTARSKGLSERRVVQAHALRNALIPTVTIFGLGFASLTGGAVLTETIFAWPGIGRYAATAAGSLDFAVVMSVTLLVGFLFIFVNFLVDIIYGFLDPRIRYS